MINSRFRCVDLRDGRGLEDEDEPVRALSNAELERQLTIAALAKDRRERFETLLVERRRRRRGAQELPGVRDGR